MKPSYLFGGLLVLAGVLCWVMLARGGEDFQPGQASDFSAVEYYTNSPVIKVRSSGAEATQMGDLYLIKQFKLEWFGLDGRLQYVATAPECTLDQINEVASSPSHLILQTADGKSRHECDGFLWRQKESLLTFSNNVHTMVTSLNEAGPVKITATKSKP